jgi:hypothetical protein
MDWDIRSYTNNYAQVHIRKISGKIQSLTLLVIIHCKIDCWNLLCPHTVVVINCPSLMLVDSCAWSHGEPDRVSFNRIPLLIWALADSQLLSVASEELLGREEKARN